MVAFAAAIVVARPGLARAWLARPGLVGDWAWGSGGTMLVL